MGDIMEITTWPKHQNVFYRITSSAMTFEVKAPGNAAIGLATKPGMDCEFWIAIGDNNIRSWIKKGDEHSKTVNTPNIITMEEYRKFWIAWYGDYIQLGEDGEANPLITYSTKLPDMRYVTFSMIGERNPVNWKFELPPQRECPKFKAVTGGEPRWLRADTQLPDGALIGGYEKETLYVIRASHRGSLTPGKFVPSEGSGYIAWGGNSHEKNELEVLCGYDCIWVATSEDKVPVGAIVAGYSEDRQERLYVGRALHDGHLIPGKVQPSHKVCYIPYDGKEIARNKYEILVAPDRKMRCANKYFIPHISVDSSSDNDDEESRDVAWPHFRVAVEDNDDNSSNHSDEYLAF